MNFWSFIISSQEDFEFHGTAREWFGIWIVNLLLSILTLGIYSAWAKVRSKEYFYQNTWVAGRNFDYHATGQQVLIGRLIVVGAIFIYAIASVHAPPLAVGIALAVFIFMPVLIVRSAKFNARNSSWGNVRFNFDGTIGNAYRVYLGIPMLLAISVHTAFPFLERAIQRFSVDGHSLGKTRFHFDGGIGPFYKIFAVVIGVGVIAAIAFTTFIAPRFVAAFQNMGTGNRDLEVGLGVLSGYFLLLVFFTVGGILYKAMLRNHVYNHTSLGPQQHRFRSTVSPMALLWIAVSNVVAVICTLGLMLPWARVRMHRYLAANTAFLPNGSIEDFTGEIISDSNAIGDAYSDIEGIDLGLSI